MQEARIDVTQTYSLPSHMAGQAAGQGRGLVQQARKKPVMHKSIDRLQG